MLLATDSVQLIQRIPYQGSSWRASILQYSTNNSHCEKCRRPHATE